MLEIVVDVREHILIEKLRGLASESKSTIGISVETLLLGDILLRDRNLTPETVQFDLRDSLRCASEISSANPRTPCPAFFTNVPRPRPSLFERICRRVPRPDNLCRCAPGIRRI